MYRIEVAPGEETVFRSMEELAVAIRNGVVTPRARARSSECAHIARATPCRIASGATI